MNRNFVNGRQFSIINDHVIDLTTSDLIYVKLELKLIVDRNMLDKLADPLRLGFVRTFVR